MWFFIDPQMTVAEFRKRCFEEDKRIENVENVKIEDKDSAKGEEEKMHELL